MKMMSAGFDLPARKPEPPHKTLEDVAAAGAQST